MPFAVSSQVYKINPMKKLIIIAILAFGFYHFFGDIETAYLGYALERDTEQAYANGRIPSPAEFENLVERALIEDLIANGFSREEATEAVLGE